MHATVTRLAPSPTGAMHLGNARTFVINAILAAQRGWRTLMRIEDLDGPRTKAGATDQLLDELAWLGLSWEPDIVVQSAQGPRYEDALNTLIELGVAYPCICSRKDIEIASSAPHVEDAPGVYPGICRERFASLAEARASGRPVAWRLVVPDEPVQFIDQVHGRVTVHLPKVGGDFVIYKNTDQAAYQLAVVLDDAAGGIDAIVRGDDLLESAARQIVIRRLLGLTPEPDYWHVPLVIGPDGKRLAKRHGDTRLAHYRQAGTTPERILGWIGAVSGLWGGSLREASLAELVDAFDLDALPREPVVFTAKHDAFLTGG